MNYFYLIFFICLLIVFVWIYFVVVMGLFEEMDWLVDGDCEFFVSWFDVFE